MKLAMRDSALVDLLLPLFSISSEIIIFIHISVLLYTLGYICAYSSDILTWCRGFT